MPPIIVQIYLYFIFRMFPVVVVILLAFEEKAIDWIRICAMTPESPFSSIITQKPSAVSLPYCPPHCLPMSLSLIEIMATYHSLQVVLPTLVTSVLCKKIWGIAHSFQLEYEKKKLETTGSLSVFIKAILFHFANLESSKLIFSQGLKITIIIIAVNTSRVLYL